MKKNTNERMMSSRQKLVQMQHYWNDLSHMATDDMKKKLVYFTNSFILPEKISFTAFKLKDFKDSIRSS